MTNHATPPEPTDDTFAALASLTAQIKQFEVLINSPTYQGRGFHTANLANKQLSMINTNLAHLRIILTRIKLAKDPTELNLDLKSLYIFSKVLTESLLYLCSFFVPHADHVDWTKLGAFLNTTRQGVDSHTPEFKNFWSKNGHTLETLQLRLSYRNHAMHEKRSTVEWTSTGANGNHLRYARIENVAWSEDSNKQGAHTATPQEVVKFLNEQLGCIVSYLTTILPTVK